MWILARQANTGCQTIPSWTGFNIRTRDQVSVSEDIVEYLPTINAPATELTTVFEILNQSELIRRELSLQTIAKAGRLLLHAAHAVEEGYEGVVVCSEDTDVFIMALAFHDKIEASLFQKCGTKTRTRVIDIRKVAGTLGIDVCRALIGIHSFTGCDTVSAFAGKGKTNALKLLKTSRNIQNMFSRLGEEWELQPELMNELEVFTCLLYAPKGSSVKFNELRYNLFCAKKGEIESHQLPPCRDCLGKHAQRANYQAGIWKRCLSSIGNGGINPK